MVRIWEQCLAQKPPPSTLPPIIPVIVHHSETGWTAPTHFQGLFDATTMADADLRQLTPEFDVQLDDISHWAVLATPNGQRAILQLFSYLSKVAPSLGPEEVAERIQRAIPERNDIVSTLAEKWLEEGEKKGIEKGYRALVRRQIELKFGSLDSITIARLESANETALEGYSERVLTATSVDGVLGD